MPSHEVKCHVTVEYKQLPLILASDYKKEISSSSSFQSSYNQVERSVSVSGSAGVPGIFSASLSMSLAFKNVTSQSSGCSDFQFKEESKMREYNEEFIQLVREVITTVEIDGHSGTMTETKIVDSIPKDALLTPEQLQKKAEDFMKAEYDNGTGTGMVFGPRCTFSLENQVDEISAEKFYGDTEVMCRVTVEHTQQPLIKASDYKKVMSSSSSFKKSYNQVEKNMSLSGSAGVPGIFDASLSVSAAFKDVTAKASSCSQSSYLEESKEREYNHEFLQIFREVITEASIGGQVCKMSESKIIDSIPIATPLTPEELQKKSEDYMKTEYDNNKGAEMRFGPRSIFLLKDHLSCDDSDNGYYVADIEVNNTGGPAPPPGYLSEDINKGFGGEYVWLKPIRTNDSSRAASAFRFYKTPTRNDDYDDLAKGTGGEYRYLERVQDGKQYITSIELISIEKLTAGILQEYFGRDGWTSNLNEGRGGRVLYLGWNTA